MKTTKKPCTEEQGLIKYLDDKTKVNMKISIRERSQKVLQFMAESTQKSLRAIAKATGISKSSVQRHLKRVERRQNHAESYFWEPMEGQEWLKLLVFAVVYHFGIKKGGTILSRDT